MPAFDAGEVVSALDWDFTKAGVPATGTVPEPSDKQIGAFLDGLKKLYLSAQQAGIPGEVDVSSPEDMMAALNALTGAAYVKFMSDLAGLFATLCSSQPSKEQLLKLPLRVRQHFYAWVQGEVVNPEAGTGAGNAVVTALPSAAAG